ncbi:hypothetical protein [Lysobacter enzymogenes]|uniref:Uncharacterized protein n=1 Tax=Lysobacter enzymogenes TaxID=69 RepID=A0A3N2RCT9_LYSEN|nr:hypothetical protein [Lysobacter enzymogenes]ROU05253.1 hypothetical protein D9T17_19190 [Lysobacter enzymogenes]
MPDLSPFERAALFALCRRAPLFKWEREAPSEPALASLERKGLIARDGEGWRLTESGRRRTRPARAPHR